MVSPKPLSGLVSDVTLIAFPIAVAIPARGGRALSSRESFSVSHRENGFDSDSESDFRRKPEFTRFDIAAF
jgi:hypothetical protein